MEHLGSRLAAAAGLVAMMGIAMLLSTNRRLAVRQWRIIIWGITLQLIFGFLVLRTGFGNVVFNWLNDGFVALIAVVDKGSQFVFGPLLGGNPTGELATTKFVTDSIAAGGNPAGAKPINGLFVFAFAVLPTIIFFSALSSILYHLNILQAVVKGVAWVMQRTLKTSGAETLSAAANIFVGQTEAPLLIKPYLSRMTRSEIMCIMASGFANTAGGVLAFYVLTLGDTMPRIAAHLLTMSVMSAPAALLFAKLMVPEEEVPETADTLHVSVEKESVNVLDAASIGTSDGLKLALNVAAMLIAFVALIQLVDVILAGVGGWFYGPGAVPAWLSLRGILGILFTPFAFMLGITEWNDAVAVGKLLGVKMVATELVAYLDLKTMIDAGALSPRAQLISAYALCGFANFASIGIQIGGLAAIAPNRRADLSRLGLRAMFAGTLASNATACVAAMLL